MNSSKILEAIERVKLEAKAEGAGDLNAHTRLLKEIHALTMVAEKPAEKLMRMRFQFEENLCVRVALEYGILQAIVAKKGKPVTAKQLAAETGADELLIIRTMRLVTYTGVCGETDYATYASNDTTAIITQKGFIGGEKHHTDMGFAVGSNLISLIRKGDLHQFPEAGQRGPFEHTFGMPIFEYFQENAEQKEAFDDYMVARRDPEAPQWFEIYPAKQNLQEWGLGVQNNEVLMVDIGGGVGHEVANFRKAFPEAKGRFILQDLPVTFERMGNKEPEGVELMTYNFFEEEQPVKHARIYFLRNIMHDWSDGKCSIILRSIVKAMDPNKSRILIDDYVLPNTGADRRMSGMDFLMFMFPSGMERTVRQWEDLLGGVGLEILSIWRSARGEEAVIEAKVRQG